MSYKTGTSESGAQLNFQDGQTLLNMLKGCFRKSRKKLYIADKNYKGTQFA